MKKVIITMILAMVFSCMQAQKVTFQSKGFTIGVKSHLGLKETDDVLQAQTDTIKSIDLSGLGIDDISDVVFLPNVEKLNLSYNEIVDVEPLSLLEHLQFVNLKSNMLESINALAFAMADSMLVNVADNYISEFTYLFSTSICKFVFEGMGAQKVKDMPFWDVNIFYADMDENDKPFMKYRGNSNRDDIYIDFSGKRTPAIMDSYSHEVEFTSLPMETTTVTITNGEENVTTYLVPPTNYNADADETITLETGLPDDYWILYAISDYGVVYINDNTIRYTSIGKNVEDIIRFCYYQGNTLKGFSRFYINGVKEGDINMNGSIDINDVMAVVRHILGLEQNVFNMRAADVNKDSTIDINDVMRLVYLILYQ